MVTPNHTEEFLGLVQPGRDFLPASSCLIIGIDDAILAAGLIGGSSLIGGLFSNKTSAANTASTNYTNYKINQENNAFNASEAATNRLFQVNQTNAAEAYATEMSNTQYQRGMADMKAAGLNPMLAYSQGGASSPQVSAPSGNTASSAGNAHMEAATYRDMLTPAVTSAVQAYQGITAAEKMQAESDAARAAADNTRADTTNKHLSSAVIQQSGKNLGLTADQIQEATKKIQADTALSQGGLSVQQADIIAKNAQAAASYGAANSANPQARLNTYDLGQREQVGRPSAIGDNVGAGLQISKNVGVAASNAVADLFNGLKGLYKGATAAQPTAKKVPTLTLPSGP